MTSTDPRRARRRGPADDPDQQLQTLLTETYRQLEHAYHCSPEYGRMVERYPVLARTISLCRQAELQGEPALVADPPRPLRLLPEVRRPGHHIDHHARQRQRHGDHHRDGTGVVG
ncbi:MAG: hypothetical protein ACKO5M_04720 [Vulcanococcus sp.]